MRSGFIQIVFSLYFSAVAMAEPSALRTYSAPPDAQIVAVSSDFKFAALSLGFELLVFDLDAGRGLFRTPSGRTNEDEGKNLSAVTFSPDSSELLIGHHDGYLEGVWVQTGVRSSYVLVSPERIHTLNAALDPLGASSLILVTTNNSHFVLRYPALQRVHTFAVLPTTGYYRPINRFTAALHPQGRFAAVADDSREEIRVFDLTTGTEFSHQAPLPAIQYSNASAIRLNFNPQSNILSVLLFAMRGEMTWFDKDLSAGSSLRKISYTTAPLAAPFHSLSQDGRRLAVGHETVGCANSIEASSGDVTPWLNSGRKQGPTSVALSSDGRYGLSLNAGQLVLWGLP